MGSRRIHGIVAPMITPFKKDHSILREALREHIEFLIDNGVHGLMILGTAGEFALLSKEEREEVARIAVDQTNGRVPVLTGISDPGTLNVVNFAKQAEDIGTDAVIATPPYYYPTTAEGLSMHYEMIAQSIDIPLLIYNIPSWTHLPVDLNTFASLVKNRVITGIKYTTNDLAAFIEFVRVANGKASMLIGSDPLIYSALEAGADGAVVGIANLVPDLASSIYDQFKRGRLGEAKKIQWSLLPLVHIMNIGTFPASLKAGLKALGKDVGNVRPPLVPLDGSQYEMVKKVVKKFSK